MSKDKFQQTLDPGTGAKQPVCTSDKPNCRLPKGVVRSAEKEVKAEVGITVSLLPVEERKTGKLVKALLSSVNDAVAV